MSNALLKKYLRLSFAVRRFLGSLQVVGLQCKTGLWVPCNGNYGIIVPTELHLITVTDLLNNNNCNNRAVT